MMAYQPETIIADATTGATVVVNADGSINIKGAFFQTTQPVSAASLPLPTNAAQENNGQLATQGILLQQLLQELRIMNYLLQTGLNVKDDLDLLRQDAYFNTYQ